MLRVLYVPFDLVLGWTTRLPPAASVALVGVISGVAVMLLQKFASRQAFMARCKADLRLLKLRLRAARQAGDREAVERLSALSRRIGGRYVAASLRPALWTVPLIAAVALWAAARLAYLPVRPGETLPVTAHFEDGASGFAHIVPVQGLRFDGPAIAPIEAEEGGRRARWRIRPAGAGALTVAVRHGDQTYEVALPVSARGGKPPEPVRVFRAESPTQDQLQAVELGVTPAMGAAWWNLGLGWMGFYLLTAAAAAFAFRFLFRVQ